MPRLNAKPTTSVVWALWHGMVVSCGWIFCPQVGSYCGSDKFICCRDPRFRICGALMRPQRPKQYCLQLNTFLFFKKKKIYTLFFLLFVYILFELLGEMSSQLSDWLLFGEQGKMSERTLEGGASRVRVTSSDDSRVDRNACV